MKTKKSPFKEIEIQYLEEGTKYTIPELVNALNKNAEALSALDRNTKSALNGIVKVLESHFDGIQHANAHIVRIDEKLGLENCAVEDDEDEPEVIGEAKEAAQRVKVVKLDIDLEPEVLMDVIDELINGKLIKLTSLGEKVVETIKENLED